MIKGVYTPFVHCFYIIHSLCLFSIFLHINQFRNKSTGYNTTETNIKSIKKGFVRKHNFNLHSMQRWQCMINNGTLETLILSKMWKIPPFCFWLESCVFLWVSPLLLINKEYTNYKKTQIREKKVQETKTLILCVPVEHLIFRARTTFPVPVCTVSPRHSPDIG